MMSDFAKQVEENIREYLPESYINASVQFQNTVKGNDRILESVLILKDGETVAPVIYLGEFAERYYQGEGLETILRDIVDMRTHFEQIPVPDLPDLTNYDAIRDRLFIQLCDPERNHQFLEKSAYKKFGELAAVYRVDIARDEESIATMMVTNDHLSMWGIDIEQLHKDASESQYCKNVCLYDMNSMLRESFGIFSERAENLLTSETAREQIRNSENMLFVLTNSTREYGASVMLNTDVMGKIGDLFGKDYYVLPSSTHELILVPDNGEITKKELEDMVKSVNETNVSPEEFLSDKVQFYDAESRELLPEKPAEKDVVSEVRKSLDKMGKTTLKKSHESLKLTM